MLRLKVKVCTSRLLVSFRIIVAVQGAAEMLKIYLDILHSWDTDCPVLAPSKDVEGTTENWQKGAGTVWVRAFFARGFKQKAGNIERLMSVLGR